MEKERGGEEKEDEKAEEKEEKSFPQIPRVDANIAITNRIIESGIRQGMSLYLYLSLCLYLY